MTVARRGGSVLTEVRERVERLPDVKAADVEVLWDEARTSDRRSEGARRALLFLPPPVVAGSHP